MQKINLACLIDDDPVHVFLSKKYLKQTGMIENLMVFQNGKIAFDSLAAIVQEGGELPKVILLDLNMPIWDGWQFLDEFIKIPIEEEITIFILSSSISNKDIEKAKKYNQVSNYIIKPIKIENLISLLEKIR
ncbi:Response regulator receiver domain-containing protein [Salegentibacter echinorum]|uniref:Response regulator receiver domain-containing protein n=1 Tax=Salegentibacter echinorum TaxID=1073325 RepID=A0A1M5EBF6_SALEC|nr:response regulator [Salegentibacter echinorum]SHF76474.1 Response regulator receiver domain-containing protein [Salegentibacter echinorum]